MKNILEAHRNILVLTLTGGTAGRVSKVVEILRRRPPSWLSGA